LWSYTCSKFRKSYMPPAARIRVNIIMKQFERTSQTPGSVHCYEPGFTCLRRQCWHSCSKGTVLTAGLSQFMAQLRHSARPDTFLWRSSTTLHICLDRDSRRTGGQENFRRQNFANFFVYREIYHRNWHNFAKAKYHY
jgi:hypothetical protein